MSDPNDAGYANATVTMQPPRGMISVRADLKSKKLGAAIQKLTGAGIPATGEFSSVKGAAACIWMSPDELLVLVRPEAIGQSVDALKQALSGEHSLVLDVSDARATIQIQGENARDVLGKLTPADISDHVFQPGHVRRSRISQVAAGYWMLDPETVELICFRSSADYVLGLLQQAARAGAEPKFHNAPVVTETQRR